MTDKYGGLRGMALTHSERKCSSGRRRAKKYNWPLVQVVGWDVQAAIIDCSVHEDLV